ncbi:MAG: hypothetical protein HY917_02650 [Candidatus Diapherotrites archaeon]|nr:hypothetical protein [Candidatus Diapherotrites archaeon]
MASEKNPLTYSGEKNVRPLSLGEQYARIPVSREDFEDTGNAKLVLRTHHPFVAYCKRVHAAVPSLGSAGAFPSDIKDAVEFLGWELRPAEWDAAFKFTLGAALMGALVMGTVLNFFLAETIGEIIGSGLILMAVFFGPFLGLALYAAFTVRSYPLREAESEQVKALTFVPEIMGHMVMSMKLVPNLEKALEFASLHGRGKIAQDFQRVIWDTQLGMYGSVSEGLDALAYRWGKFSFEFKQSLMRVRSSVLESAESRRFLLLDKTMSELLESVKFKMEIYARSLSQPSMMLFYLGVLLPLILIIILPVGSSFSGAPLAHPLVLGFLYMILIPGFTFLFARSLIARRPPTYEAPFIPDTYPGLPPKGMIREGGLQVPVMAVLAVILVAGAGLSIFVSQQGFPPKFMTPPDQDPFFIIHPDQSAYEVQLKAGLIEVGQPPNYFSAESPEGALFLEFTRQGMSAEVAKARVISEEKAFYMKKGNDIAPTALVFSLMLVFSLLVFVYLYYSNIYKRRAQEEVMKLEDEFRDSLYILASRLGENKPVEEALRHVRDFLPTYRISSMYDKILENISLLSMPLHEAIFDKTYGALRNIPSKTMATSMQLLTDSVQLGVNVAARTMIALSIQLQNAQAVTRKMTELLSEITSMMQTLSIFIAPIVLGITVSLQKVVILTLFSIASSDSGASVQNLDVSGAVDGSGFSVGGISSITSGNAGSLLSADISGVATPTEFIFIIAVYIILLVIIMNYFITKIQEDNDLLVRINLAKALPFSVLIFIVAVVVADLFIGGLTA